jgi:Ca-activated chloride channel family protein
MLILSVAGTIAAYVIGEALLIYVTYLPYWLQCGAYMLFIAAVCCAVMLISEAVNSGNYILKRRQEFKLTCAKAAAITLPAALVLGIVFQLLYGLVGLTKAVNPDFNGTMIVCDISGSMLENDPERDAVEAILSYIDTVPTGEYLGVTVFNETPYAIREYAPLNSDSERETLKETIRETVDYGGGTDIQSALLTSFEQMRASENKNWPGLILLFSDGLSGIDYSELQAAALGDIDNAKNRIPVNTIYYSGLPVGGYQMSSIAQKTGGTYFYMGADSEDLKLRDVFTHSRSIFTVEKPHLLQSYFGAARDSALRIILQVLFLSLLLFFTGILVVVFLNNNRLIKHYLIPKAVVSIIVAVTFTLILVKTETDAGAAARILLAAGFCLMYLPTYSWDNS